MKSNHILVGLMTSVVMISLLGIYGCKETFSLDSAWLDGKITIDGKDNDWQDGHLYNDEDISSKIGIYNDDNDLYVYLLVENSMIEEQIFERGFTMWLSKSGENDKVWGLHFLTDTKKPEGTQQKVEAEGEAKSERTGVWSDSRRNQSRKTATRDYPVSLTSVELLTSEKETGQIMSSDELSKLGICAAVLQERAGSIVYEVKIPLNKSEKRPYAACQSKKRRAILGFLTVKASGPDTHPISGNRGGSDPDTRNSDNMQNSKMGGNYLSYRDMEGGGMGGMGGNMEKNGKERHDKERHGRPHHEVKALDFWAVIELASNPAMSR